jgi:hypothetical protein
MSIPLSEHRYPRTWLRQWQRLLLAVLLAVGLTTVVVQVIIALSGAALFVGTALFTLLLLLPILAQPALSPEVTVYAEGLAVQPLLWRSQRVAWGQITRLTAHPLIANSLAATDDNASISIGRLLHGKNYRPREGLLIVVDPAARLALPFRLLALITGERGAAFAVSSATHTNYAALRDALDHYTAPAPQHPAERGD